MAKKTGITHAPYGKTTGDLQHWTRLRPQEKDETVYGEQVEWRENKPFHAELKIGGTRSGRSAKYTVWHDNKGHEFPMFVTSLVDLLENGTVSNGRANEFWMVCRKGQNYGIRMATREETIEHLNS